MCGRYALTSSPEEITQRFNLQWAQQLSAHYNIARSQMIPVVRDTGQSRELVLLKWGLIPSWAKDQTIGVKLINARVETLADKPALKAAICLAIIDTVPWYKASGRARIAD